MRTAIYPGSFDPVTRGHLDIIKRAAAQFDRLIVCVMVNSEKKGLFTPQERVELLRRVTADIPNVEVDASPSLLADYAREKGAGCVVKGLRAMSDFEKEFQMAMINRKLNPGLETMFLSARQNYTYLSSSIAKELAMYRVPLEDFVPAEIAADVQAKMEQQLCRQDRRTD
ncbi:MAG: pantetheine-phosphate adenylyltransferase [Clostridiales bacterium]|nr:pantetheine-phosphate adenylyltransferase [Clostridiales bacterium]MCD7802624.1 pantetheine-phosphate adenylyltransferase [Clostridiales bacterium]